VAIHAFRFTERPALWERIADLSAEVWPEYNRHGDVMGLFWARLYVDFPDYQFVLYDEEEDEVLAEGQTVPCAWDGTVRGLGPGIDAALEGAFELAAAGGRPNTLCALAAEIRPRHQSRGLSVPMLEEMKHVAAAAGLPALIAPVRPNWKERYPLTPIERYAWWTRDDGQPFDPWVRVHTRLGGVIAAPIPRSLLISASVADWEEWTGMAFPETGEYVFPAGLAPLRVDRARDRGEYWEPNVWVTHEVP